ncbi:NAD(P)-binding protein [Lentinula aciculospora]|uniref:NAD(P)-binding protein n=1 Tax=Lentinula aciculospora TaxID=153920 RepID=A0A9W9DYL9_9AGAR|nr:NAD(P)-binding protein [Lentinula aciculospora]
MTAKKVILVIGATGAQGMPVVSALLAAHEGNPSPYSVRALTRNPTSKQAQALASLGAQLFEGRFDDMSSLAAAYEGCYGVFVNTDTSSVGQKMEIYAAIKMFEQAHRTPEMRHFIWSSLDYSSKLGNYDPIYRATHMDAKGIVNDFLRSQPSSTAGESLTWSIMTTGPYMENLAGVMLGPLPRRENGAVVFVTPVEDGHIPAISLEDIAWWTRYTFDHRSETSGQELKIATEMITVDQVVETFTRVTGIPAIRKRISIEEYLAVHPHFSFPFVKGEQGPSIGETFSAMYRVWRDNLVTRDMEWIRRIHPTGYTLESWMKEKGYVGNLSPDLKRLKSSAELKSLL